MEYQNQVRKCLSLLKEHIKQTGMGYQQLANRLDVSLLTVKRQLNGDEISMSKLLALCDGAQMEFSKLWNEVENLKTEHTELTREQDRAFYYFPHLFRYFLELHMAKQTPQQIQTNWGLTPASTHLYLRKLEKIGLIRLSEKGNPTLLVSKPIGFSGDSLNLRKEAQAALKIVSDKVMNSDSSDGETFVVIKPLVLPKELRDKMYTELSALVSRYAELSERYFIESDNSAHQLVLCDYPISSSEPLPEIINVTGFDQNGEPK